MYEIWKKKEYIWLFKHQDVYKRQEWYEENGEYETEIEKGGEVALEQFHISYLMNKHLNFRFGHMIVPVGLTNAHHEPLNFFGVYRPEGETTILPSTWHETGVALFGDLGNFDYELQVVSGLDPQGFRMEKMCIRDSTKVMCLSRVFP